MAKRPNATGNLSDEPDPDEHPDDDAKVTSSRVPLFGRVEELKRLKRAWETRQTRLVQIVAPGGTGKSSLVEAFLASRKVRSFRWRFASHGSARETSSDRFFAKALATFKIRLPNAASVFVRAEALAQIFRKERILLFLDGVEPLQGDRGDLRDPGLGILLKQLLMDNSGMVICTTRLRIADVPQGPHHLTIHLENLKLAAAAAYLAQLGIQGSLNELRLLSLACQCHPLRLTIMGARILAKFGGDASQAKIRLRKSIEANPETHTLRMLDAYVKDFSGQPELMILQSLAYFDRPVGWDSLRIVLPRMDEGTFRHAVARLERRRLVLVEKRGNALTRQEELISCNSLVREFFEDELRRSSPDRAREIHSRLYHHYCDQAVPKPKTRKQMRPLYLAVYHGCQADLHSEVFENVYLDRICRRDQFYLTDELGDFATDRSLLINFFIEPWTLPVATLSDEQKSRAIGHAHFALRGLGRIAEALEQLETIERSGISLQIWRDGVVRYSNASQLLLMQGNVEKAVKVARSALDPDESQDVVQKMTFLVDLADALHQYGQFPEAQQHFVAAEKLHAEREPEYRELYSIPSYRYCDLLLSLGQNNEAISRSRRILQWSVGRNLRLETGLAHIILSRAYGRESEEGRMHANEAVGQLLGAGSIVHFLSALAARASRSDLDRLRNLAVMSGMKLRLLDYYIEYTRQTIVRREYADAKEACAMAAALAKDTKCQRRESEIHDLSIQMRKTTVKPKGADLAQAVAHPREELRKLLVRLLDQAGDDGISSSGLAAILRERVAADPSLGTKLGISPDVCRDTIAERCRELHKEGHIHANGKLCRGFRWYHSRYRES